MSLFKWLHEEFAMKVNLVWQILLDLVLHIIEVLVAIFIGKRVGERDVHELIFLISWECDVESNLSPFGRALQNYLLKSLQASLFYPAIVATFLKSLGEERV